jgi:hypothetical protein
MNKPQINPIEIDIVGNRIRRITPLVFNPAELNNNKEFGMNFITKLLKLLLAVLPLKSIGKIVLNWAEERTQDTANNWDDAALYALWAVLFSLDMAEAPPEDLKERAKRLLPTF